MVSHITLLWEKASSNIEDDIIERNNHEHKKMDCEMGMRNLIKKLN